MQDLVAWSEVIRNIGIVVGGAVGLGIAAWRGWAADRQARAQRDQAAIGRRQHVTELYSEAVGHLGHERLEVRLGAIYALHQIAIDFPEFAQPVFHVLDAYLRERSSEMPDGRLPVDLEAIEEFLRTRYRP